MKFIGKISNGKLTINNQNIFLEKIRRMKDGEVALEVKKIKKGDIRSLLENSYYWGVLIAELSENGDDPEYWHQFLKIKFIAPKITGKPVAMDRLDGDRIAEIGNMITTTTLTISEFEKYLSEIREWASKELKIYLPLPNESTQNY